jgi:hypothetical protein
MKIITTGNRQRATGKRQKFNSKSNAKVKTSNICCSFFKSNAKGARANAKSKTHV